MTTTQQITIGATVRYSKPQPGEEQFRFTVLKMNGDRCLIQLHDASYRIQPVECLAIVEVESCAF